MLSDYVNAIVATRKLSGETDTDSFGSLRGWLDDSMINYLAGTSDTINVSDRKTRYLTSNLKSVPKSKKTHISLALALGMGKDEINHYLELMGFSPLEEDDPDEACLIQALDQWDGRHPLQRKFKEKHFEGCAVDMKPEQELAAVKEMLSLRQELQQEYSANGKVFTYLKD